MDNQYFTCFRERRTRLDRRYRPDETHVPERRSHRQRRSGLDRRKVRIMAPDETDYHRMCQGAS